MAKRRTRNGDTPTIRERKLGRERAHGLYWPHSRTIELDSRLSNRKALEIILHESFHDAFPYLGEEEVTAKAKLVAKSVWAVVYRRIMK